MTKHIHAELMMQYAEDAMESDSPWEGWEFHHNGLNEWIGLVGQPAWDSKSKYRRKASIIKINGYEVPEPVRKSLKYGDIYYTPCIWSSELYTASERGNDCTDDRVLKRGLVHLTKEAAVLHAEALLSFTEPRTSE